MTGDAARRYTLDLSDLDLQVVRSALVLLLSAEDDPAEIDRIQQLLGRLPGDGAAGTGPGGERGFDAPDPPWS